MVGEKDSQMHANSTQLAKKPFQCNLVRASVLRKVTLTLSTSLGGQTVKNLRSLACNYEFDRHERNSLQAIASTHKSWPNGVISYCNVFDLQ